MDNVIDLSIRVPTYNHEKYIAEALDSILMQETSYTYEVLIGEDCSTDGTADVLREYEKKYPGRFQVFYRKENMYGKNPSNGLDLRNRCKGRYTITLEGDDFWIDSHKIEKQIKFLDTHPDYIAVAHRCMVVGDDSQPIDESYPECKEEEYTFRHYLKSILPGQTATVMCRNFYNTGEVDTSILEKGLVPGDRLLYFVLLCYGKVYCMPDVMSAYRHVTTHGSSFSATFKYDFKNNGEYWHRCLMEYGRRIGGKPEKYADYIYFAAVFGGFKKKQCSFKELLKYFSGIKKKGFVIRFKIQQFIVNRTKRLLGIDND